MFMQRRSFMLSLVALPAASLAVLQLPSLKAQILRRARELITDKRHWITRKAFGLPPGGCRLADVRVFSAYGAIYRAGYDLTRYQSYTVLEGKTYPITEFLRPEDLFSEAQLIEIMRINNTKGHQAVLAHLDSLIQEV